MCTALCIVDVITEAQDILTEITGVLESHLHLDAVCLSLEVDRLMKCLRTVVQITDVSDDPLRLMVFQFLRLRTAQILEIDRQGRIQVCCLMETALDLCCRETGLLKDLRVRKEIDAGSGRLRASKFREKPLLQFDGRDSPLIMVMMYISIPADLDIQISRKRIDNRGTDTVETAAGLVCGIVELAACMQGRKDKTLRGHSFLMHIYRDSSSVICYGRGTVLLQCHMDLTAISGKVLIYCIVYDLIDQMIQSLAGYTSNIHTRSFPDCLQSFQNRDTASIIGLLFCHGYIHFLSYAPFGA